MASSINNRLMWYLEKNKLMTDDHKSLHRLNPFKLAKAIDSAPNGKIVNVTKLANNFLLLETNSAKQSQALLSTKSLEGIPVNITPHNSLNFTRSVIKTGDLQDMSEEDIIAELYSEGVIRCKRIKITRNSQIIQTNTYILTFNRLQLLQLSTWAISESEWRSISLLL